MDSIFHNVVELNKILLPPENEIYQCPTPSVIEKSGWIVYGKSRLAEKVLRELRFYSSFYTSNRLLNIDLRSGIISDKDRKLLEKNIQKMFEMCPTRHGLIICHPRIFHQIDHWENLKCVTFGFMQDTLRILVCHQDLWTKEEAFRFRLPPYCGQIFYRRPIIPVRNICIYDDDMESAVYAAYAYYLLRKEQDIEPQIFILSNRHFVYSKMEINKNILKELCPFASIKVWRRSGLNELFLSEGVHNMLFIAPQHRACYVHDKLKETAVRVYTVRENMLSKLYKPYVDSSSFLHYIDKSVSALSGRDTYKKVCLSWKQNYQNIHKYTQKEKVDILVAAQHQAKLVIEREKLKINQMFG